MSTGVDYLLPEADVNGLQLTLMGIHLRELKYKRSIVQLTTHSKDIPNASNATTEDTAIEEPGREDTDYDGLPTGPE